MPLLPNITIFTYFTYLRQGNLHMPAYYFSYFVKDQLEARIMWLKARLADVRALRAASAME